MVETIAPVVYGGRNRTYWLSVGGHVLGATCAAALFGMALGALGSVARAPWGRVGLILLAAVALLYAAREAFALPVPLFDRRRQVPQWWRDFYGPGTAAFLYGAGLGIGFFTYLTFGTYLAVVAAALLSGNALTGALLCGVFGLARGLSVLVALPLEGQTPPLIDGLDRLAASGFPRALNAVVLSTVAVVALATR